MSISNFKLSAIKFIPLVITIIVTVFTLKTTGISAKNKAEHIYAQKNKPYLYKRDTLTFKYDTIIVSRRTFLPDHFMLQHAGNIGFMAIGLGYDMGHFYQLSLLYGFLNEQFGDSKVSVNTVSLKNNFSLTKPLTKLHFKPTAGLAINWGYTKNTFHKLPEHYPDKYYFQNKVHLAPFIGGEFSHHITKSNYFKSVDFYYEFSSLDAYILEWIRRDYIKLRDVLSLSIGLKLSMK